MSSDFDSYDDCVRSDNRLVLLFSAIILVFFLGMVFVSAGTIETKGGVYNGGFEYGTGSVTAGTGTTAGVSYIGDKDYGWQCFRNALVTGTCTYSTTQKHSGNQSIKIDTNSTGATGIRFTAVGINWDASGLSWDNENKINIIRAKPNTTYKYSAWVYNEDANIANIELLQGNSNGTFVKSTKSPYVLPTATWTYLEIIVTTAATTQELSPFLSCASNASLMTNGTCYFDDVRLEEVDTLSLTTQQQGRPSVTITGVTDTNAIDQSQTTTDGTQRVFGTTGYAGWSQTFIPTQKYVTGISFRKSTAGTGLSQDTVITLRPYASTTTISSTILASKTITAATMNAYADSSDIFVELPAILDANGTNVYEWIMTTDSNSTTNYIRIAYYSAGGYGSGTAKYSANKTTWRAAAYDLYFKTHFAKHSSSVDLNVVAPDGSSELKSFDVNGDILTDANITINPNGTGTYSYLKYGNPSLQYQDIRYDLYNDTTVYGTVGIGMIAAGQGVTYKINIPTICDVNKTDFKFYLHGAATRYVNLWYSKDNITWTYVDRVETGNHFWTNTYSAYFDNQNYGYLKVDYNAGAQSYLNGADFDANLSCPSLATPLFKNGTNTIYTMNKDADNQAGATITPSLMSNITFIEQAKINTYDENTALPLDGVNINFNGNDYTTTDSLTQNTLLDNTVFNTTNQNFELALTLTPTTGLAYVTDVNVTSKEFAGSSGSGTYYLTYYYNDGTDENSAPESISGSADVIKTFTNPELLKPVKRIEVYVKTSNAVYAKQVKNLTAVAQEINCSTTIPLTGLTVGKEYTLTFSKTGYSTRTYTFTASTTNFIDLNFALLPTELSQEINFKFFEPDEVTAYANIYIETKKGTLTLGRQKTNTLGEITLYLDQNATGLTFDMNNGENTYQAVLLTINRPKSETTLLDIPENWGYEISGLASYLDSNISGNTQTFAIYSNTLQSYTIQITSQSTDPAYTPRKYDIQIIGDQNTYTLQPYLISTDVSVTTTLYTINAYTNQAISDITIKIYRNLPVTGKTLIEQTITDSKGQSIVYLILNQTYSFEIIIGETIIRTETYSITATSPGIWFKIDPGYVFETKPALNNVLAYWTPGKNWLGEADANISTKIEYQTAVSNTRTVSSVVITCDNKENELFQDNFSNPIVPFTQTYDFNLITKTINSVNFDGNYPITCLTRITLNDGNIIEATQTYVARNDSPQQNLGFNLRPAFGCTATNDPNIPCPSMIFFALLATMMLTAGIMIESGFTQPEFAGILFFVGLGFFTFFTWIPPFLYVVALVMALLVYVALGVRRI